MNVQGVLLIYYNFPFAHNESGTLDIYTKLHQQDSHVKFSYKSYWAVSKQCLSIKCLLFKVSTSAFKKTQNKTKNKTTRKQSNRLNKQTKT